MNNFLKKAFSGIALAVAVLAISQPLFASIPQAKATGTSGYTGASLNSDPRDFALVEVSNETRCPNSASCYSSSISGVQNGDVIAFVLYAHNTGPSAATNTRLRLQVTDVSGGINGAATLSADNGNTVTGSANVGFASGVNQPVTLQFMGGEYYANSSVDPIHPDSFPNGQTAAQVSQNGINIGTLANDYAGQFDNDVQVVVRYKVNTGTIDPPTSCTGTPTLEVNPSRDTIYVGETAQYQAIYDSNGTCSGGQTDVTNVASWTVNSTSIANSYGNGQFRGNRTGDTTVRASYNGYSDSATLTVRDNGGSNSCDGNDTLVITPYQASFGVGQTYSYRALYDADGPGCSGSERDVTNSATWSSDSSSIASSQDDGRFRGVNNGYTTVRARYSGITATASANVYGNTTTGGGTVTLPTNYVGGGTVVLPTKYVGGGTVTLPSTVIGGGTVIAQPQVAGAITAGVTDQSVACITVTPSVDVASMLPGQDIVYTTLYRNDCPFALNNAVLRVYIPNDVEFIASSNPFFIREGQKFSYNIGVLPPGGQGSVAISGLVRKDSQLGDTETFTSTIEFLDSTNRIQGTTSYLVAVLGGDVRRAFSANVLDTLGAIFTSLWFWLLIVLLVLAAIIWFIVSMIRRRTSTTKVVVANDNDPLRALRNA